MELILKVAAVCLSAAVFALAVKKDSPVMALLITSAAGFLALYFVLEPLRETVEALFDVAQMAGISSAVLTVILKTVGISIVARLSADICKDAGMAAAASAAELAGAAAALFVSMPMLKTMLDMIRGLM